MEESSSRITFTGQNLTDLLDFPLDDGVLLKQDLEKEDVEEHVVLEEDCGGCSAEEETVVLIFFSFLWLLDAFVKRELRKVASRPPGERGCFTFFKSV